MTRSHEVSISDTSSLDLSDDLPPPSPIPLSPIDLPSSLDVPPSPVDHRKQRFPSTNLTEDFVKITWETESVQSDSFCISFYNAIYPEKFVRWFRGLPRSMRILLIASLFLLLLLISIGIVMLIIFVMPGGDDPLPPYEPPITEGPVIPRGKIAAMGQFAIPIPYSSMQTLTPSPDSSSVFFAYDNINTLTVIEKTNTGIETKAVKVDGMNHDGCFDYFPLSFSSKSDSISANLIPWCCSSPYNSFCYAFNAPTPVDNSVLVYKSFQDNALYFTTLTQVGNYCNMTNYRITNDQSSQNLHTEQCYGHLVPVQAASSTYCTDNSNTSLITSVLLNDNSLHASDGSSIYSVYPFTSDSILIDQLLLQYRLDQIMIGAVTEWGASIARVKDSTLSLLQFTPFLPFSGTLRGAFFDIQSSLTLFHSIDNGRSMWISEYAFSWIE